MPACQLWDKYLVWRRERPIVLRVFQKIIHLKEVTFHYAWTIPVLLKKYARKKRKKRSCNFLNCKKIFFLSLSCVLSTWVSCCVISAAGAEGWEMQGQVSISGEAVQNSHLLFSRYSVRFVLDICGGQSFLGKGRWRIKKNQARFLNVERVSPFFEGWRLLRALRKCLREEKAGAPPVLQVKGFLCGFKHTWFSCQ